jgi:hypothetical protein
MQAAGSPANPRGDDKMQWNKKVRFGLMVVTIVAVALLGVFGTAWAQGGTEGTVTGAEAGPQAASGICKEGLPVTLTGADVTDEIDHGVATHQLLSNKAGVANGSATVLQLAVPIVEFTSQVRPATNTHEIGSEWTLLTCAVHGKAKVESGLPAAMVLGGQAVCFDLPAGAAAMYKQLNIHYYDAKLVPPRWVKLKTTVDLVNNEACHSTYRLLPSIFALWGSLVPPPPTPTPTS